MLKLAVVAILVAVAQANLRCIITARMDCTKIAEQQVCADNYQTYRNTCAMNKAGCALSRTLKMIYNGKCEDRIKPECKDDHIAANFQCTELDLPLCGSDGKTYTNKCEFHLAKCALWAKYGPNRASLRVRVNGRGCLDLSSTKAPYNVCADKWMKEDCAASQITAFTKTCDQNDNVYANRCYFHQAQCQDNTIQQKYCAPV